MTCSDPDSKECSDNVMTKLQAENAKLREMVEEFKKAAKYALNVLGTGMCNCPGCECENLEAIGTLKDALAKYEEDGGRK